MRKFGLLLASMLFLSFGSFANEDGQGPGTKEPGIEKNEKGTGGDGLIATGDKNKPKKPEEKKKPTTPPPANK